MQDVKCDKTIKAKKGILPTKAWYIKAITQTYYVIVVYSLRSHWSPVVVVLLDGIMIGMSPQCGPSTEDWIWISWQWVLGRRWMRQSSDKRIIRKLEKRHRTLMFPISWSNRPPSAPATRMHSWHQIKNNKNYKPNWACMPVIIQQNCQASGANRID